MDGQGILEQIDLTEINRMIEKIFPDLGMSFKEMAVALMKGEISFQSELLFQSLYKTIISGFLESKNVLIIVIVLGIFGGILTSIAHMFQNKQVVDIAHYFVYLLLSIILIRSFKVSVEIGVGAVQNVVRFMQVLLPAYCLSIGFSNGTATAYSFYQFGFLLIFFMEYILLTIFISMAECYVFLAVMNGISSERRFDRVMDLLEKIMSAGIKGMIYLTIACSMLHTIVTPALDRFQKTLVQKSLSVIPGIGDISDSITSVFLSAAALIKSSIGVAALICILFICLVPLAKLFVLAGSLKVASAVIGVFGERKLTRFIDKIGVGSFMIFKIVLCTGIMFFISVAMIAKVIQGG